jgi:transcriptional regulator with XRE-family HTH domain
MTQRLPPQVRPHEASPASTRLLHNRVAAVLMHVPWYSIVGPARLARDAGVDKSTISRLLAGRTAPSYRLVMALTSAIERRAGREIGASELFSTDGNFPTEGVCSLMGCPGCLPGTVYDIQTDIVHPEFRTLRPGTWALLVRAGGPATVTMHGDRNPERGAMT